MGGRNSLKNKSIFNFQRAKAGSEMVLSFFVHVSTSNRYLLGLSECEDK
jgi:hypothetical protein